MLKTTLCALALFLATFTSPSIAADTPTASPLAPIQWLIGDWHATAKGQDGTVTEVDSHVYWNETHTAIFFMTKFNGTPHYSGMYAYDPAQKQIGFWYVDSEGQFTKGTATPDGQRLLQKFEIAKTDGTVSALTSVLQRRPGDTGYHWQVFRPDQPEKPLIELDYTKK